MHRARPKVGNRYQEARAGLQLLLWVRGKTHDVLRLGEYVFILGSFALYVAEIRVGNERVQIANFGANLVDYPVAEHVVMRLLEREQKEKLQKNIKPVLEKVAAAGSLRSASQPPCPDNECEPECNPRPVRA